MPTAEAASSNPPSVDLVSAKARMRAEAVARRRQAAADAGRDAGPRLAERFFDLMPAPVGTVSGFMPIGDEIDPRPLMDRLAGRGCRIALPVVVGRGRPLLFRAWHPGAPLERRPMGLMEPPASAEAIVPDVLLVPLLAFDAAGHRLGYGAGYYDRTLAALRGARPILAIGLAYEGQRVARVPADAHDEPLDAIVTEAAIHRVRHAT